MVREWVKIDVFPQNYTVNVQFVFTNDGPVTTVKMGFPESGSGVGIGPNSFRNSSAYSKFETSVDGRQVSVERVAPRSKRKLAGMESYGAFWVNTVHFDRKQTHIVRVSYQSRQGGTSMGDRSVEYDFTGGNWKGLVSESDLLVTFHIPGTTFYQTDLPKTDELGSTDSTSFSQSINGNLQFYCWKNWRANDGFETSYYTTDPKWIEIANAGGATGPPFVSQEKLTNHFTLPGKPYYTWFPQIVMRGDTAFIALGNSVATWRHRYA